MSEKRNRYNESFDPLFGRQNLLLCFRYGDPAGTDHLFFPSDFIYIQACWDYYRYYLAPIIVCADLILSFGTSHQAFKQAPFEEPVSHYCLCDYFIFIGAWKRMACSFLEEQTKTLISSLPDLFQDFQESLRQFLEKTPFADSFNQFFTSIDDVTSDIAGFIGNYWESGAQRISNIFSTVTAIFITLFTGPIVTFFLLRNPQKFYQSVLAIVPPAFRTDFKNLTKIANQQLGSFLKGQIIASFILGAVYWVCFLLIGLEFASVLAISAGLLCIIPYIGPFIAFFPGLIIAFQDSTFMAVKFVIVWFAVQLLHGDLVIPRVMGDRLQIHPITILIVLLVMGDLMGIVGVIFGIPIYTLVKLLVTFIFRKFKQRYNKFYGDKGEYEHSSFSEEDYFK